MPVHTGKLIAILGDRLCRAFCWQGSSCFGFPVLPISVIGSDRVQFQTVWCDAEKIENIKSGKSHLHHRHPAAILQSYLVRRCLELLKAEPREMFEGSNTNSSPGMTGCLGTIEKKIWFCKVCIAVQARLLVKLIFSTKKVATWQMSASKSSPQVSQKSGCQMSHEEKNGLTFHWILVGK